MTAVEHAAIRVAQCLSSTERTTSADLIDRVCAELKCHPMTAREAIGTAEDLHLIEYLGDRNWVAKETHP